MSLWKSIASNANSDIAATMQVQTHVAAANQAILYGNTTSGAFFTGKTVGQFGITTNSEQALNATGGGAPAHSGWVLRTEGSGGRAGRVTYETLVATGSITRDPSFETILPEAVIKLTSNGTSSNELSGNAITLQIAAVTVPSGGTISYKWQQDDGPSVVTFADIPNTGIYATSSGNTSNTLGIKNNANVVGNVFRVVMTTANGNTAYSANITVTNY